MRFIERYLESDPLKISAADMEAFVNRKVEESSTLDYKDAAILHNPEKILKHVCGFANSFGGLLVIGVSETEVTGSDSSVKVYPNKITWSDGNPPKERIEHVIRGAIDPEPSFAIFPVRKTKDASDSIYLIDVSPGNHIHLLKRDGVVYIRKNFETVPLSTRQVIDFANERASLQKCGYFRSELEMAIIQFISDSLIRCLPSFNQHRFSPHDLDKHRRIIVSEYKKLMFREDKELARRFSALPIYNLRKLKMAFDMFVRDMERVDQYPHSELSADEQNRYVGLKEEIIYSGGYFDIDEFLNAMRQDLNDDQVDNGTLNDLAKRGIRIENEYVMHIRFIQKFTKAMIKMAEKIDEMRQSYGSLAVDYSRFSE